MCVCVFVYIHIYTYMSNYEGRVIDVRGWVFRCVGCCDRKVGEICNERLDSARFWFRV